MKKASMTIALAACMALALPALAGEGHGCTASTQDCLNMMASNMRNKGWLGVELEKGESGLLGVTRVVPGSPAEEAGVRTGDMLLSVDGQAYKDMGEEQYMTLVKTMTPGSRHTFVIARGGSERTIEATLASMPEEVFARMVGSHMLEHAQAVDVATN